MLYSTEVLCVAVLRAPSDAAADVDKKAGGTEVAVRLHCGVHLRHASCRDGSVEAFKAAAST